MNEAETRAELIDPKLLVPGWGVVEGTKVLREFQITAGEIKPGVRAKPWIADYVLVFHNRKLAVIEAKSDEEEVGEGVAQAKITRANCNWKPRSPATAKKFIRCVSRPALRHWSRSSPRRRSYGTKHLRTKICGARSSMRFRLKMSAAPSLRPARQKIIPTRRNS